MFFSKDSDAIPTFEFPGSTGAGPRQHSDQNNAQFESNHEETPDKPDEEQHI